MLSMCPKQAVPELPRCRYVGHRAISQQRFDEDAPATGKRRLHRQDLRRDLPNQRSGQSRGEIGDAQWQQPCTSRAYDQLEDRIIRQARNCPKIDRLAA